MQHTPVFSSFMRMKRTNPHLYHSAKTHQQMLDAQRKLGIRFYDKLRHGGGEQ
jgi:hypothetical protein